MSIPHTSRVFVRFAIMIEDGDGSTEYVRGNGIHWGPDDEVLVFLKREDADAEAAKWNTGKVVEWQ